MICVRYLDIFIHEYDYRELMSEIIEFSLDFVLFDFVYDKKFINFKTEKLGEERSMKCWGNEVFNDIRHDIYFLWDKCEKSGDFVGFEIVLVEGFDF